MREHSCALAARAHRRRACNPHPAGAPAAHAAVNNPYKCPLKTSFVTAVYNSKTRTVSGSLIISNPTAAAVPVEQGAILAVTSTIPKGSDWQPPPPNGLMYGKLRLFRPYNGPYYPQAILEFPVPKCLDADGAAAAAVAPGKSVTCAFTTPAAAVAGTDAGTVKVSVSYPVQLKGADPSGMCAADAAKLTVI